MVKNYSTLQRNRCYHKLKFNWDFTFYYLLDVGDRDPTFGTVTSEGMWETMIPHLERDVSWHDRLVNSKLKNAYLSFNNGKSKTNSDLCCI